MFCQQTVLMAAVSLAALVGGALSAPVGQCPSSTPPDQQVFLPSDSSCAEFYLCSHGVPHRLVCPGELYFNPATSRCDYRHNVPCDLAAPPVSSAVRQGHRLAASDVPICPSPPGPHPALFPNPANCSTYYMCSGSTAFLMPCPDGLLFNNDTWTCDHPQNVVCPELFEAPAAAVAASAPLTAAGVAPTCPPVDGVYPTFFPNPHNCSTFYMCSHGVAFLYSCPAGLHFNRYTNTCDYPWRARCTEVESQKSAATGALARAGAAVTCPSVDGKYPTFLSNPYDCTTFYMCSHGTPYLFHCPAGLHFNTYTNTCDYPWRARCTEVEGQKSAATGALARASAAATCPSVDGKYPTFLSNPYDCTTFYMCSHGTPYLFHCPAGLHFSRYTNTCDYPWRARCTEVEGQKSAKTALARAPVSADTCPEKDGEYPVYLPNPHDCTTFYLCSNGVPYLHHCPEGLHFNINTSTCDFPWHAGCQETNGTAVALPAPHAGVVQAKTLKQL